MAEGGADPRGAGPPGEASGSEPFADFAARWHAEVERALDDMLPGVEEPPADLHRAMRYALFPGGKRLRPTLALLGARVCGGDLGAALRPAAALECLHTYSLVHDDLPCMDDDGLRRGRPTCHVEFGDALAVLAGDALLTLSFEVVSEGGREAVRALARAAGSLGMVGGQAADLAAEAEGSGAHSLDRVAWIHDHKTGALIMASLEVGALAGGGDLSRLAELRAYGELLGRAFQIADDCLDMTGAVGDLGKRPGADIAAGKLTYPAVMGLEASCAEARRLAAAAAELAPEICRGSLPTVELDAGIRLLQDVASYSVTRTR
jgi:geranylgeranyl diphosphate synthase type II